MNWSSRGAWIGSTALLSVLAAVGIASLIWLPPLRVAPTAPSPSQTAQGVPGEDVVKYAGATTCETLLPADVLENLDAGYAVISASPDATVLQGWPQRFSSRASLVCAIDDGLTTVLRYMYGPIENEFVLTDALNAEGYVQGTLGTCQRWQVDPNEPVHDFETGGREPSPEEVALREAQDVFVLCGAFWVSTAGEHDDAILEHMIAVGRLEYGG